MWPFKSKPEPKPDPYAERAARREALRAKLTEEGNQLYGRPLPPFDTTPACPKCGSDVVTARHEPEVPVEGWVLGQMLWNDPLLIPLGPMPSEPHPERMARSCGLCKWTWYEAPLDAAETVAVKQVAHCEVRGGRFGAAMGETWGHIWQEKKESEE